MIIKLMLIVMLMIILIMEKNIVIVYKNAYLIRLKHKNKMKKY